MAIRIQLRRDTAANWVSANPTLRAGEVGIETDTLKFKIGNGTQTWSQITTYANVTPSSLTSSLSDYILAADQGTPGGPAELDSNGDLIIPENSVILWNDADYDYTTTLTATQPTANRTITIPNATGTVALTSDLSPYAPLSGATFTGNISLPTQITFEGATADAYETVIAVTDPTSDRVIVFPDVTGNVVTTGDTSTVTNLMLAGSIANDKLSNSAITINGTSTSLGGTRTLGTDDITEGSTNKYFTDERAQDAVSTALAAGTHTNITVTYNDAANSLSLAAAPGYVDEQAVDAVATALAAGTHTNISVSYNDAGNAISLTGAVTYTDENAQDAVGNAVGTGLSYNDTTGAISVDTSTIQARVTDVSDTEIGYLNGVTSAIQTQINDKAPISNPTFTGTVTLPGAPTSDLHAATKAYVDAATSGLNVHASVKAATTANVSLNNSLEAGDVLDGVTLAHNDRVLVKNQDTTSQNGIYIVQPNGAATRATDYDSTPEVDAGDFIFVESGTVNGKTGWIQTNTIATIGTDPIEFSQFSGAGAYLAGNGLTLTGNSFSINTGTTADLSTAQTLTNKTINANANTITVTSTNVSDFNEAAQDAIGNSVGTGLTYTDSTGAISVTANTYDAYGSASTVAGNLSTHESDTTTHGTTGNIVGTSDTQTLTNKTLTSPKINEDVALTATATELNYVDGVTSAIQTQIDTKVSKNGGDTITASSASTIPLIIKGAASRSVALQDWQTSDGTSMLKLTDTSAALSIGSAANTSGFILLGGAYAGFGAAEWYVRRDGGSLRIQSPAGSQMYAIYDSIALSINGHASQTYDLQQWKSSVGTVLSKVDASGNITAPSLTLSTTALATTSGGTGLSSYTSGDVLYASATNTLAKLAKGTDGQILTLASGVPSWAAAPITLPTQTDNSGKYLTTDGSTASWGTLVVPITTGTATITANTATTIDTNALSGFTSIEYMVSLKQGSKVRTSKVIVQTDGTSVDMTEFAITETGGTIAGVVVSAAVSSTNAVLQVTVTDATTTNVTVKFSEVKL